MQVKFASDAMLALKHLNKSFRLEYDVDYGIDHRKGWSITVDGSVVTQFKPTLTEALIDASEAIQKWEWE
jgi:hypothetical protein